MLMPCAAAAVGFAACFGPGNYHGPTCPNAEYELENADYQLGGSHDCLRSNSSATCHDRATDAEVDVAFDRCGPLVWLAGKRLIPYTECTFHVVCPSGDYETVHVSWTPDTDASPPGCAAASTSWNGVCGIHNLDASTDGP